MNTRTIGLGPFRLRVELFVGVGLLRAGLVPLLHVVECETNVSRRTNGAEPGSRGEPGSAE